MNINLAFFRKHFLLFSDCVFRVNKLNITHGTYILFFSPISQAAANGLQAIMRYLGKLIYQDQRNRNGEVVTMYVYVMPILAGLLASLLASMLAIGLINKALRRNEAWLTKQLQHQIRREIARAQDLECARETIGAKNEFSDYELLTDEEIDDECWRQRLNTKSI